MSYPYNYEDLEIGNSNPNLNKHDNSPSSNTMQKLNPRIGFIRKVYGILTAQLLITLAFCIVAVVSDDYKAFTRSGGGHTLTIISIIMVFLTLIPLICCKSVAKTVPTNYILLFMFTFGEAYLVSLCCAQTKPKIVLMALVFTTAIVIAITLYALTTQEDFTMWGGLLFVLSVAMLCLGIFLLFTDNKFLHVFYCTLGVIFFGIYLIYDTQLIAGGKSHELGYDDYILGALMLYLDIINIFMYILELLSAASGFCLIFIIIGD